MHKGKHMNEFQKKTGGNKGVDQGIIDVGLPHIGVMGEMFIAECMAELKIGLDAIE